MADTLVKRKKGTFEFPNGFEITGQAPCDSRLVLHKYDQLTATDSYTNGTAINTFAGMTVTVLEGKSGKPELWSLKGQVVGEGDSAYLAPLDYTVITNWEQVSADSADILSSINSLKIEEVTTGLDNSTAKRYRLVGTDGTALGATIDIPFDKFIKSAKLGQAVPSTGAGDTGSTATQQDCLILEIATDKETTTTINIPLGSFLREAEFKNGLQVEANGEVSVKIDTANSMSNLKVDANGLKLEQLKAQDITFASTGTTDDDLKSTNVQNAITELLGMFTSVNAIDCGTY